MKRSTWAWQWIGALLVDGVLGRHHQKWLLQWISRVADGDLPLLHRFKQRTLHLCRRAIDLVGEDDIGEDGSSLA